MMVESPFEIFLNRIPDFAVRFSRLSNILPMGSPIKP